jgi:hypothetical protein
MKPAKIMKKVSTLRAPRVASTLALALALSPSLAFAQEGEEGESDEKSEQESGGLGLAPGIPQVSALAGGFSPAYAPGEEDMSEWHADFHGFLTMPLNIGLNKRSGGVTDDQYKTVMHAPPMVPEYRDAFSYTSVVPSPYAQLNFSYGNPEVSANVIIQARSAATGSSYFDASTAGGVSDAFVTFTPQDIHKKVQLVAHVGAFTNRYGVMGQYDEGRYGTPLFARTNGVGENIISMIDLGDFDLELQHGFQGQIDKAPLGIVPGDWNDYADPNLGTSFVHHVHAGLTYKNFATLGGHYMNVWTADDRANMGDIPDGKINLVGGDLRLTMGRYGHLFFGATSVDAQDSNLGTSFVHHVHAGLTYKNFATLGGQYDLSVARALYGDLFYGESPDIVLSAFMQRVSVKSDDENFDGIDKQKFGVEAGYSFLPWMAASLRFDAIAQDMNDVDESSSVISPRIIFRSDWQARDQVVLQYSKYIYGDEVYVRTGTPAELDPAVNPDEDVVSLSATMWW